jgi:hypothetical protein
MILWNQTGYLHPPRLNIHLLALLHSGTARPAQSGASPGARAQEDGEARHVPVPDADQEEGDGRSGRPENRRRPGARRLSCKGCLKST